MEIEGNKADIIMNSKSEWNQSRLPRIIIETGEDMREDEASGINKSGENRAERRGLKMSRSKNQKRNHEVGEEGETWEGYKRRKMEECQSSVQRIEETLKERKRAREMIHKGVEGRKRVNEAKSTSN